MSFFTNNILLQRIFFMKRRCVVFFPSIFRQMSDIVGDRTLQQTLRRHCDENHPYSRQILLQLLLWLSRCLKGKWCYYFLNKKSWLNFYKEVTQGIFITMSYVNVSDATVKLFVDSGVNLGGNDSLFSTGGKNSAHNISAISGGIFAFFTDISLGNL